MTEERRTSPRHTAFIAGEIETTAGKSSITITRDVSAAGLLVFSRREHQVGDAIKIRLLRGEVMHEVAAKVVRQERLAPDESTLWRTKVGVVVDDADAFAKIIAELDRQT
jgi:hypothetical protein